MEIRDTISRTKQGGNKMENNKKSSTPVLKGFTWLIAILSALLVIESLLSLAGWMQPVIGQGLDKILTNMAQLFSYAAVLLIVVRLIWNGASKVNIPFLQWLRSLWKFFRQRHVFFGWIVAAAGTAHSLYFLIFLPRNMNGVVSGLLALAVMAVLVLLGYVVDNKARSSKLIKNIHRVLGILFIASILFHTATLHGGQHPRGNPVSITK
jgi:hypothetical protein